MTACLIAIGIVVAIIGAHITAADRRRLTHARRRRTTDP